MFILKTSLSLLLFFVFIIYFTIRKVNPLCEKIVSSQRAAHWTAPVGDILIRRPAVNRGYDPSGIWGFFSHITRHE